MCDKVNLFCNDTETLSEKQPNESSQHIQQKKYVCEFCGLSFNFKCSWVYHRRRHLGDLPHACEMCDKKFAIKYHLVKHVKQVHVAEKSYVCELCSKAYKSNNALIRHVRRFHQAEKNFECDQCDRKFFQIGTFKMHYRIHTGEKAFECDLCAKKFRTKQHLLQHYEMHSGEKPYVCDFCSKAFSQKRYLQSHLKNHTGKEMKTCDICQRTFRCRASLYYHKRCHHSGEEKSHVCNVCDKAFYFKTALQKHLRIHTTAFRKPQKYFKCEQCSKFYVSKGSLKKHLQKVHTKNNKINGDFCDKVSASNNLTKNLPVPCSEGPDDTSNGSNISNKSSDDVQDISIEKSFTKDKSPVPCTKDHEILVKSKEKEQMDEHCLTQSSDNYVNKNSNKLSADNQLCIDSAKNIVVPYALDKPSTSIIKSVHEHEMFNSEILQKSNGYIKPANSNQVSKPTAESPQISTNNILNLISSSDNLSSLNSDSFDIPKSNFGSNKACSNDNLSLASSKSLNVTQMSVTNNGSSCDKSPIPPLEVTSEESLKTSQLEAFQCSLIEERSVSQNAQSDHYCEFSTVENPYACHKCSKTFSEKDLLSRHLLNHEEHEEFYCNICKKYFCDRWSLRQHIRIHTGEKPYSCDVCQEAYANKKALKRHMNKHGNEECYCSFCKKYFRDKKSFCQHMEIHTGVKPYSCDLCQKVFARKGDLTKHIKKIHST